MVSPEVAGQIADLGLTGVLVLAIVFVSVGLHRGWIVPSWVYRSEVERRVKAETEVERMTEFLEGMVEGLQDQREAGRHDGARRTR